MGAKKAFKNLLLESYQKFELDFDGKKVWVPYRINIPFESDRRRYGKWSADKIKKDTIEIADDEGFDLEKATAPEIREFMEKQLLGIDCSGYVYQLFDVLLAEIAKKSMEKIGFPFASSTNVQLLTDEKFARRIEDKPKNIKAGDMIRFGPNSKGQWHVAVVMENDTKKIVYSHSSAYNVPNGICKEWIEVTDPTKSIAESIWHGVMSDGRNRGRVYISESGSVYRLNQLKY